MTTSPSRSASFRRPISIVLVAIAIALLPGCTKRQGDLEDVRAAVDRTRQLANRFVYTDERADQEIVVRGIVEDDFRVKARVEINGRPDYEQVVSDDTLAVRFLNVNRVDDFLDASAATADQATELEGISAVDVLRTRRWMLDPAGAPLPSSVTREEDLGENPVLDAISALDYVRRALGEAVAVERWREDDLSPVYSSSEDNFPRPEEGSGVTRYDLRRPPLPAIGSSAGGGGDSERVGTKHFRKMAIYIKDGRIIRVIERIEVLGSYIDEVIGWFRQILDEVGTPDEVREGFEDFASADLPEAEKGGLLLEFLNVGLEQFGQPPLLVRNMVLDLGNLGDFIPVVLPDPATEQVVEGSLEALSISGYHRPDVAAPEDVEGVEADDADGGSDGEGTSDDEGTSNDESPGDADGGSSSADAAEPDGET